jgi:hypothetical protein
MDSRYMTRLEQRAYERGNLPPASSRIWNRGVFAATFGDSHVDGKDFVDHTLLTGLHGVLTFSGTDLEGGLLAPSLQSMSSLLLHCLARDVYLPGVSNAQKGSILDFARKCGVGAAFDKVRFLFSSFDGSHECSISPTVGYFWSARISGALSVLLAQSGCGRLPCLSRR